MSFFTSGAPAIMIEQATAPATAAAGMLWWDTDDLLLYYYTGSSWVQISSASDAAGYEQIVANIVLEILRLSAEGTLTAPDYNNMFVDYFADEDGQDGTIDTAETTALFSTDTYTNNKPFETTEQTLVTLNQKIATSNYAGYGIMVGDEAITLKEVEVKSDTTATKMHLFTGAVETAVVDITSKKATFNNVLAANTKYTLCARAEGASYDRSINTSASSFPYNYTDLSLVNYVNQAAVPNGSETNTGQAHVIQDITYTKPKEPADYIVKTNAQALEFNPAYILVHSKDKTLTGTGSITYDVYFDGGTTPDSTGNALDAKIPITDGSGKNMVINLNLNGVGTGNTSELKDYEAILWSS